MTIAAQPTRKQKGGPLANLDGVTFVVVVNDTPFVVGIAGEDIERGNALWIDTSGSEPVVSVRPVFTKPKMEPDLVALIRQAEWSGYALGELACPWCNNDKTSGHLPTCPVAPVLYPKEQA